MKDSFVILPHPRNFFSNENWVSLKTNRRPRIKDATMKNFLIHFPISRAQSINLFPPEITSLDPKLSCLSWDIGEAKSEGRSFSHFSAGEKQTGGKIVFFAPRNIAKISESHRD